VSVARFNPITISRTCCTIFSHSRLRSNWPKCLHLASLARKDNARIERADVRSVVTELTHHRLPSCFFLFTGVFYFRLRGIFRSAVTGRPEMSRVAVTRLFRFIPGNVECERETKKKREKQRRDERKGRIIIYIVVKSNLPVSKLLPQGNRPSSHLMMSKSSHRIHCRRLSFQLQRRLSTRRKCVMQGFREGKVSNRERLLLLSEGIKMHSGVSASVCAVPTVFSQKTCARVRCRTTLK